MSDGLDFLGRLCAAFLAPLLLACLASRETLCVFCFVFWNKWINERKEKEESFSIILNLEKVRYNSNCSGASVLFCTILHKMCKSVTLVAASSSVYYTCMLVEAIARRMILVNVVILSLF